MQLSGIFESVKALDSEDILKLLCGELLGQGDTRAVYSCALNSSYVIKIEKQRNTRSNIIEHDIWQEINNAKWLAPCDMISICGRILVQQRTLPVLLKELPKRVPAWMADLKRSNWGRSISTNTVVCHDYANHRLYSQKGFALVKAEWRDF